MASDPICGMYVPEAPNQLQVRRGASTYYFCSTACLRTFQRPAEEQRRLVGLTTASFVAAALILVLMFDATSRPLFRLVGLDPWTMETRNLVLLILATPIQFVAGARFYAGFGHALRARAANMDTLIALGTSAAYGFSAAVALLPARYGYDTYFDTSVLIIGFILLGRTLENRMKEHATDALRALVSLQPRTATVLRDGAEKEVPVEEVRVGDRFRLRPGGRFPTDGRILDGEADVDESLVTGESLPVHKRPGDEVIGASINLNGSLLVEASRVGSDTLLAQIATLVEQAQAGKAPIQRLVDAVSAKFVPAVILVAGLSAVAWYLATAGNVGKSALVFVSVVIIACPCALGLATPAALLVGVGRAAQKGILVKETAQFEAAAKADLVVFDKTGTLTVGRPEVTQVVALEGLAEAEVLGLAAAVESQSEHPLAAAVVRAARERRLATGAPRAFQSSAGQGVQAFVDDGEVVVGTASWLRSNGIDPAPLEDDEHRLEAEGNTVLLIGRAKRAAGVVALADTLKPGSAEAVRALTAMGIQTALLSGDNATTAKAVATRLGIPSVYAPVLPADKAARIQQGRARGRVVAMVGDGVNDAPALAAADVGFALGGGTDVAREAGGILLLKDDPRDVVNAIELARKTRAKIRQNLFWAFVYNVALIPVAALGLLDPILSGAAMALSSVTVVGNSLTLRRASLRLDSRGALRARTTPAANPPRPRSLPMARMGMMAHPAGTETDPVCGMKVDPSTTPHRLEHAGRTYYFCSAGCRSRFAAGPAPFLRT